MIFFPKQNFRLDIFTKVGFFTLLIGRVIPDNSTIFFFIETNLNLEVKIGNSVLHLLECKKY